MSSRHGAVTGTFDGGGVLAGLGFTALVLLLGLLVAVVRYGPIGRAPVVAGVDGDA